MFMKVLVFPSGGGIFVVSIYKSYPMKKYLLFFLSAMMLTFGCYDDTDIRLELQNHENRISELETLCSQFNTNITALQSAVTALQNNVYVTSIAPVKSGSDVIGYVIVFSNSESITIYHGTDGKDGADGSNGKDGISPVIGVRADADGVYYWTLNGDWLLGSDGNKIQASGKDGAPGQDGTSGTDGKNGIDGNTPKLKIVDGYWYVSYDGGQTWESETLGQATGDKGYTMFEEVTYDTDYVYITMAGGEKLTLPRVTEDESVAPAIVTLSEVTGSYVVFDVCVNIPENELPYFNMKIYYSCDEEFSIVTAYYAQFGPYLSGFEANKNLPLKIDLLKMNTKYNYCVCFETRAGKIYSDIMTFQTPDVLDGQWVMNEIVTDDGWLSDVWFGFGVTMFDLPEYDSTDTITFDLAAGKAYPSFNSTYNNYFIGEANIAEIGEYKFRVDLTTTLDLRLIEFDNINRYFHPTEKSEDTKAYVGFRVITDAVTGDDLLDMYVIDHTSKSFMPELLECGIYNSEKPVAAIQGTYLNATFKRAPKQI